MWQSSRARGGIRSGDRGTSSGGGEGVSVTDGPPTRQRGDDMSGPHGPNESTTVRTPDRGARRGSGAPAPTEQFPTYAYPADVSTVPQLPGAEQGQWQQSQAWGQPHQGAPNPSPGQQWGPPTGLAAAESRSAAVGCSRSAAVGPGNQGMAQGYRSSSATPSTSGHHRSRARGRVAGRRCCGRDRCRRGPWWWRWSSGYSLPRSAVRLWTSRRRSAASSRSSPSPTVRVRSPASAARPVRRWRRVLRSSAA